MECFTNRIKQRRIIPLALEILQAGIYVFTFLSAMGIWNKGRESCIGLGAVFLAIWLLQLWDMGRRKQERGRKACPETVPSANEEEYLRFFAEHAGFTLRETEIFERLILSEAGVQEIADELYISRRNLQRHIASIYAKAGTKSRIGLLQGYVRYRLGKASLPAHKES